MSRVVVTCPICFGNEPGNWVSTLCGHVYHYDCLSRALQSKSACPECRAPIITRQLVKLYLHSEADSATPIEQDGSYMLQHQAAEFTRKMEALESELASAAQQTDKTNRKMLRLEQRLRESESKTEVLEHEKQELGVEIMQYRQKNTQLKNALKERDNELRRLNESVIPQLQRREQQLRHSRNIHDVQHNLELVQPVVVETLLNDATEAELHKVAETLALRNATIQKLQRDLATILAQMERQARDHVLSLDKVAAEGDTERKALQRQIKESRRGQLQLEAENAKLRLELQQLLGGGTLDDLANLPMVSDEEAGTSRQAEQQEEVSAVHAAAAVVAAAYLHKQQAWGDENQAPSTRCSSESGSEDSAEDPAEELQRQNSMLLMHSRSRTSRPITSSFMGKGVKAVPAKQCSLIREGPDGFGGRAKVLMPMDCNVSRPRTAQVPTKVRPVPAKSRGAAAKGNFTLMELGFVQYKH